MARLIRALKMFPRAVLLARGVGRRGDLTSSAMSVFLEYLAHHGVWPGYPVPSVRWLTASAAVRVRLYPRLPLGASEALVYRFTVPGELGAVRAVQVEAVDADGARLDSWRYWNRNLGLEVVSPTKRPSVAGSDTDGGRRVFLVPSARAPAPGVHVCEGPVDALGLVALEARGLVDLGGSAVIGVAGNVRSAGAGGRGVVRCWRRPSSAMDAAG